MAFDTAASLYAHRSNPDGAWDAICLRCYLTIATGAEEASLADAEAAHKCDGLKRSYEFVVVERRKIKRPKQ